MQGKKTEEQCFYQNVQCVIVKKSKFIEQKEASRLLSSLEIKDLSVKFLYWVLFCFNSIKQVNKRYKVNEIVNNFLLAGDKVMPEMHLRQPGFTYSTFGPFTKNKERIQKFKETGDSQYIYQNKLDKAYF